MNTATSRPPTPRRRPQTDTAPARRSSGPSPTGLPGPHGGRRVVEAGPISPEAERAAVARQVSLRSAYSPARSPNERHKEGGYGRRLHVYNLLDSGDLRQDEGIKRAVPSILRFAEFEFDPKLFQIRRLGAPVRVERRVFDLIWYLASNAPRVVGKEELLREVWGGRVVTDASISVAVASARRALGDTPRDSRLILTHHGRGYRFAGLPVPTSIAASSGDAESGSAFVGRRDELDALLACFHRCESGHAQLAFVVGEPGIGKTRLIHEFAAKVRSLGARAFVGRCREEAGAPAYWPWAQIVRSILQDESSGELSDCPLAEQLAPVIGTSQNSGAKWSTGLEPSQARFQLFDSVAQLLRLAARQVPLVIALDDLHGSDRSSLLLLDFALRNLETSRITVIATYRPAEVRRSASHSSEIAELCRTGSALTLQLSGLSQAETGLLLGRSHGHHCSESDVAALYELTGGNPFFISQIAPLASFGVDAKVAASFARLPHTVREAILRQVDAVAPETRTLLNYAAVVGREFSRRIIEKTCGLFPERVAVGLNDATEAGLIGAVDQSMYRFSHALVREVLYQQLAVSERARIHGRVADALESGATGFDLTRAVEIAHHRVANSDVGEVDRAISACERAASLASESLAHEEAIEQLRTALRLLDRGRLEVCERRVDLLLRLGAELVRTGNRKEAKSVFEQAAALAERIDASDRLAEAALGAVPGLFAVEAGIRDEFLISLLRRAVASLGDRDQGLRARLLARLGVALFWTEDTEESGSLSREAWGIARSSADPDLQLYVLLARWLAEWKPWNLEERWQIADGAVRVANGLGRREELVLALLFRLAGLFEQGAMAAFDHDAIRFRKLAESLKQPQALWYARLIEGARALHRGNFAEAAVASEEFYEISRRIGDANGFHSYMAQRIISLGDRGEPGEVVWAADEARRRFPDFIGWRAARCWGFARDGQLADARREFEAVLGLGLGRIPRKLDWPTALVLMAESARILGAGDAGEEVGDLLAPFEGRVVVLGLCVMSWGSATRYLGQVAEAQRRWSEAARCYEQAMEENARADAEPWVAHCELDLARVRATAGRTGRATAELARRALARAERLGMPRLSEAARARL